MEASAQSSVVRLAAYTERRELLDIALKFIGEQKRPIEELPAILAAIENFLRPPLSSEEMVARLRRLIRS